MAPYNQYTNFYDPVGNHATQPQGYTYQTSAGTQAPYVGATTSNYQTAAYNHYNTGFGDQHYNVENQNLQPTSDGNRAAAVVLSNLGGTSYSQPGSVNHVSSRSTQFETSNAASRSNQTPNSYGQVPNRRKSNVSPLQPSNTNPTSYGRFVPQGPPQGDVSSYNGSQDTYQTVPSSDTAQNFSHAQSPPNTNSPVYQVPLTQQTSQQQQQQNPPPRYKSPLHAIEMQQSQPNHYVRSPSNSTHQPSPQMTSQDVQPTHRQRQLSVGPSQTTVNPSQVYDIRAEQHRKAEIEAQRRKKAEAEEAFRKAKAAAHQEETDRVEQERRRMEEDARQAEISRTAEGERASKAASDAARKKVTQERRKEQRRNVREERRQSDSAASTLQRIASSSVNDDQSTAAGTADETAAPDDEESQMRAMFQKMREFNHRNPAMLAQLWEEERQAHALTPQSQASKTTPTVSAQSLPKNPPSSSSTPTVSTSSRKPTSKPPTVTQSASVSTPTLAQAQPELPSNNNAPSTAMPLTGPVANPQSANIPQQQGTTTLWPPHKRNLLADTASRWLSSLSANSASGRALGKADILKFLDSNPSYSQLCEAIERSGITFERSALARVLLKVVPGGLKPQTVPRLGTSTASQVNVVSELGLPDRRPDGKSHASSTTVSYQVPSFTPLTDIARSVNGFNASSSIPVQVPVMEAVKTSGEQYQSPYASKEVPNAGRAQTFSVPLRLTPQTVTPPLELRKPPADKEEAARKRTFSDLVDLTGMNSDDDDDVPPRKILQLSSKPLPEGTSQAQHHSFREPMTFQQFKQTLYQPRPPQAHLPDQLYIHPPIPPKLSSPALPAPSQNIPTSLHPPHPPPSIPSKPRGPSAEQQQLERIRGKMLVEPLMRDRVARKSKYDSRTIARDVLLATGRHPDMRTLNGHLNPMDKLLSTHGGAADGIGNKSDLSTIRWDIIDPGKPVKSTDTTVSTVTRKNGIEDDDDEAEEPVPYYYTPKFKVTKSTSFGQDGKSAERPKVRRGRPSKSAVSGQDNTLKSRDSMSLSSTPAGAKSAVGYAAFRQLDENGNVIKKKGRPVGWRKNVHSREAHGMPPATSLSVAKPRPATGPDSQLELQKQRYEVYHCGWRDCSSELHNLEVLKKHIIRTHGHSNDHGDFECAWRGCLAAHTTSSLGSTESAHTASFSSFESWVHHVDREHLQKIAWELGDGPRGGTLSEQSDPEASYLSDAQGRSVTPVISPRASDASHHSSIILASGHLNTNLTKDQHAAAKELKQLEEVKRNEGPYMGTEGTRLANAKRRLGFLDDEEFADEVESNELGED